MDDYSSENLEKIRTLGTQWWEEFGNKSIKFINSK